MGVWESRVEIKMTDFIRIHHADTDAEAKARYKQIVKRLEELGPDSVRATEFPTQWAPIIRAWLKDK